MKKIITLVLLSAVTIACQKSPLLRPRPDTTPKTITATPFKNVIILGNSITYTPGNPSGEWKGSWGMAATTADSDYVHRLTVKFQTAKPGCVVTARNIMAFEEDWDTYNIESNLSDLKGLSPDLVILRIGEDVPRPFDREGFGKAYKTLVDYFGKKTVVLGVGSFWPRDKSGDPNNTDEIMATYPPFVSLASLGKDRGNYASNAWPAGSGIGQHPNDKGMAKIAGVIWSAVQQLQPTN